MDIVQEERRDEEEEEVERVFSRCPATRHPPHIGKLLLPQITTNTKTTLTLKSQATKRPSNTKNILG